MKSGCKNSIVDLLKEAGDVASLFSDSNSKIEWDAAGVPAAFRVFRAGQVELTKEGQAISGEVALSDLEEILAWHVAKGNMIPVDCEHYLAAIASKLGIDEDDLVKRDPILGEKAAGAAVRLEMRGQELWAVFAKWSDRARELLSKAGRAFYMYFSPMIRGLANGPLRITSVTLTNEPALNHLESFAMSDRPLLVTYRDSDFNKENTMKNKIIIQLAGLLGMDTAALTEGMDVTAVIEKAASEITSLREARDTFLGSVKDSIGLTDGQGFEQATGLILSLKEKSTNDEQQLTDLGARVEKMEALERDRLIEQLTTEGRLTAALKDTPWFKGLDYAALKDWSEAAPVIVPPGRDTRPDVPDVDTKMTDNQRKIASTCGVSAESFAKANKLKV